MDHTGARLAAVLLLLAGLLPGLHVLLAGDVFLRRPWGDAGFGFWLRGAQNVLDGAEAAQTQNVHEKTREGQREGEDADEESRRSSAPAPRLPAAGLQQERPASDQDPDSQIHHRIHQPALRHLEPCVTDGAFYAQDGLD